MPAEIRVYVEGHKLLRSGLEAFFGRLREAARSRRMRLRFIPCKGLALEGFRHALQDHPNAFNILLVDAEQPVTDRNPWAHLANREENRLARPRGTKQDQAHLMVQIMESWFLADKQALEDYYGQDFKGGRLPRNENVESIAKSTVHDSLTAATERTKKGKYHKTRHAPDLLKAIDPDKVCDASPWCKRLFTTIGDLIGA